MFLTEFTPALRRIGGSWCGSEPSGELSSSSWADIGTLCPAATPQRASTGVFWGVSGGSVPGGSKTPKGPDGRKRFLELRAPDRKRTRVEVYTAARTASGSAAATSVALDGGGRIGDVGRPAPRSGCPTSPNAVRPVNRVQHGEFGRGVVVTAAGGASCARWRSVTAACQRAGRRGRHFGTAGQLPGVAQRRPTNGSDVARRDGAAERRVGRRRGMKRGAAGVRTAVPGAARTPTVRLFRRKLGGLDLDPPRREAARQHGRDVRTAHKPAPAPDAAITVVDADPRNGPVSAQKSRMPRRPAAG